MNLAIEHLRDYLTREKISQRSYADACDYDASLVSDVLRGTLPVSARNLPKLLAGISTRKDKLNFLSAYLRDQIPPEHTNELGLQITDLGEPATPLVEEVAVDPSTVLDEGIRHAVSQLPTQTKAQVYRFVKALRVDPLLRNVFDGLMHYVPPTPASTPPPRTAEPATSGTAGPFPIEIIRAAQARNRGRKKSSPEEHTHAPVAPAPTPVVPASKRK